MRFRRGVKHGSMLYMFYTCLRAVRFRRGVKRDDVDINALVCLRAVRFCREVKPGALTGHSLE